MSPKKMIKLRLPKEATTTTTWNGNNSLKFVTASPTSTVSSTSNKNKNKNNHSNHHSHHNDSDDSESRLGLWNADSVALSRLTSNSDHSHSHRSSFLDTSGHTVTAVADPSILPRTSWQARMSQRTQELDLCQLRFRNVPLLGRQLHLERLQQALEDMIHKKNNNNRHHDKRQTTRGLVLVHGESGTGKTSLIQEWKKQQQQQQQVLWTLGKCELQQVNEPYAGVQDAMGLLCNQLLQLPPQRLEDIQEKLTSELDFSERHLLVQAVPGLDSVLKGTSRSGNDDNDDDDDNDDSGDDSSYQASSHEQPKDPTVAGADHRLHKDTVTKSNISSTTNTNNENKNTGQIVAMDGAAWKEASYRLKYVIRHFMRIVSSVCPLVLILDDCQWADRASLQWVQSLITDTEVSGKPTSSEKSKEVADATKEDTSTTKICDNGAVLVVATFRSNEVDDDHELSKMLNELRAELARRHGGSSSSPSSRGGNINASGPSVSPSSSSPFLMDDIEVGNLSVENINSMLVKLLVLDTEEECKEFAQLVHQKTMGNAFFVVQFLLRLNEERQLSYSLGLMKWEWDLEAIRSAYSSTENVADLMKQKLQRNEVALGILPVAACFGSTFSPALLQTIMDGLYSRDSIQSSTLAVPKGNGPAKTSESEAQHTNERVRYIDVNDSLQQCVQEGFLDTPSSDTYRFIHDKIQEAALEFLSKDVKIAIGDIFLDIFSKTRDDFGEALYSVVNLVNLQMSQNTNDDRRLVMAEMNGQAGRRALECAAFGPALAYLTVAVSLLPGDHWAKNKDLSLNVYTLVGAAEFCNGNHAVVKQYADIVYKQKNVPLLDKIDLCNTLMDAYTLRLESKLGLDFGLKVLRDLDCRFPKSDIGIAISTVSRLLKAKVQLKEQLSVQNLERRPIVNDFPTLTLMKALDKLANASFHAKPKLLPLIILEMTKCNDRVGLTAYGAVIYPLLGILFAGVHEDFPLAKLCGEAGLAIMKRANYPALNSRCIHVAYFYCLHWSTPIRNCARPLLEGYKIGMRYGTLEDAFWCVCFSLEISFWTGEGLSLLHVDYLTYIHQMEDYNAEKPLAVMKYTKYMVARLLGYAEEADEEEYIAECEEKREKPIECTFRRSQMYVACILGDHEKTAALSKEWQPKVLKQLPAQATGMEVTFVSALSCMAVSRKDRKSQRYVKQAKMYRQKIKSLVAKSCPNCVAQDSLLDAEWFALKKKHEKADSSYESAVLLAGRRGLVHVQALANERFAIYLEEVGNFRDAGYRFREALALYKEWGATVKVQQLRKTLDGLSLRS